MRTKATLKFNGGLLAILCSKCSVIIKTGKDFTEQEKLFVKGEVSLPPQYCEKCIYESRNFMEQN